MAIKRTDLPTNEQLREPAPNLVDLRQQQIDPAGKYRVDPDRRTSGTSKQPGIEDMSEGDPPDGPDGARAEAEQSRSRRVDGQDPSQGSTPR